VSSRLVVQVRLQQRVLDHEKMGKGEEDVLCGGVGKDRLRRSLTGLTASPQEHSLA